MLRGARRSTCAVAAAGTPRGRCRRSSRRTVAGTAHPHTRVRERTRELRHLARGVRASRARRTSTRRAHHREGGGDARAGRVFQSAGTRTRSRRGAAGAGARGPLTRPPCRERAARRLPPRVRGEQTRRPGGASSANVLGFGRGDAAPPPSSAASPRRRGGTSVRLRRRPTDDAVSRTRATTPASSRGPRRAVPRPRSAGADVRECVRDEGEKKEKQRKKKRPP